ncbi:MAG: PorP/SprF family type IX secretion system membrane protein [Bacteroidales bacterium]
MKINILTILFFYFLFQTGLISQNLLPGNLYTFNKHQLNAAYAGISNEISAFLNYRNTSSEINGAPVSISAGVGFPVYRNMSLGARFDKQSEGLFDAFGGKIDYSYRLEISDKQKMNFGISAGINSHKINYSSIVAEDPDAIIEVASKYYEGVSFQAAAGMVYFYDNFEWSLAFPQLLESKNKLNLNLQSLFMYNINLQKSNIKLRPSVFLSYDKNNPFLFDINFQAFWKEMFWLGAGYRNRPGILASLGFNIRQTGIAYSVEIGTEKFSNAFNQVHEIAFTYSLNKKRHKFIDSTDYNNQQIVVNVDSLKQDTSGVKQKIETVPVVNAKLPNKDSIITAEKSKYTLVDAGGGIYYLTSVKQDSLGNKVNEVLSDNEKDSILLDMMVHKISEQENQNLKINYDGNGIYTIKPNKNANDTLADPELITEEMLDSLENSIELNDEISTGKKQSNEVVKEEPSGLYTIELLIPQSDHLLLSDSEVVGDIRLVKSANGGFRYYYGFYNTETEARQAAAKFSKYKDIKYIIIKTE